MIFPFPLACISHGIFRNSGIFLCHPIAILTYILFYSETRSQCKNLSSISILHAVSWEIHFMLPITVISTNQMLLVDYQPCMLTHKILHDIKKTHKYRSTAQKLNHHTSQEKMVPLPNLCFPETNLPFSCLAFFFWEWENHVEQQPDLRWEQSF